MTKRSLQTKTATRPLTLTVTPDVFRLLGNMSLRAHASREQVATAILYAYFVHIGATDTKGIAKDGVSLSDATVTGDQALETVDEGPLPLTEELRAYILSKVKSNEDQNPDHTVPVDE